MYSVKVEPISREAFAPFGEYYSMADPEGYAFCGEIHRFFPDRLRADARQTLGFSPLIVEKPQSLVITQQERHTTTWELVMPLNDDMILHCSPATPDLPDNSAARAFFVPRHTLVKMNAAVWHMAPLPKTQDQLHTMVILPVCTYANDCRVVDLTPEQQFELIL